MKRTIVALLMIMALIVPSFADELPDPALPLSSNKAVIELPEPISSGYNPYNYTLSDLWASCPEPVSLDASVVYSTVALWDIDPGVSSGRVNFFPLMALAQAVSSDASTSGSSSAVGADVALQGLLDNEYYRESVRLKKLADDAFEYGDYDAAKAYAEEAAYAAQKSDEYIALQLKIKASDDAYEAAKARFSWAGSVDAANNFPGEYSRASSALQNAAQARTQSRWDESVVYSRQVVAALQDVRKIEVEPDEPPPDAAKDAARQARADALALESDLRYTAEWAIAEAVYKGASESYGVDNGRSRLAFESCLPLFRDMVEKAKAEVAGELDGARAGAETAKDSAQALDASTLFAAEWAAAEAVYADAKAKEEAAKAGDLGSYKQAVLAYRAAAAAYEKLSELVKAIPPKPAPAPAPIVEKMTIVPPLPILFPLPEKFVVRAWTETRDCLWNIAGLPWIYNDPEKWPLLYEANKKALPEPENPDLLPVGTVLIVPSLNGEVRKGTWDKGTLYQPLPNK